MTKTKYIFLLVVSGIFFLFSQRDKQKQVVNSPLEEKRGESYSGKSIDEAEKLELTQEERERYYQVYIEDSLSNLS